MDFSPYGVPQGSYGTGFGFTGEYTDANDLLYLRARYYAPDLGLFNALDPLELLNRYFYVGGNPINRVDPTGMQEECGDPRTKNCCGLDVTQWFLDDIRIHAEWAQNEFETYAVNPYPVPAEAGMGVAIQTSFSLLNHLRRYARAIPHKWMNFDIPNIPNSGLQFNCPSDNCTRTVTVCGKCIDRSEMGNMIFGMVGAMFAISPEVLWGIARSPLVNGLAGPAEQSTAGIGINLASQIGRIRNAADFCEFLENSDGSWELDMSSTNIPVIEGVAVNYAPDAAPWQWEYANAEDDSAQCAPCSQSLPLWFAHTIPVADGDEAGTSVYANRPGVEDPFYVYQISSPHYLSPELCPDADVYSGTDQWICGAVIDPSARSGLRS